jgi:hypothetical protein
VDTSDSGSDLSTTMLLEHLNDELHPHLVRHLLTNLD